MRRSLNRMLLHDHSPLDLRQVPDGFDLPICYLIGQEGSRTHQAILCQTAVMWLVP